MKNTTDIILLAIPVILNGALVFLLILNRREQIRYDRKFKERMDGIRRALNNLKNDQP